MRSIHTLYQGTASSAQRVSVPFIGLPLSVRGLQASLMGLIIRVAKGGSSAVRPGTATAVIRDSVETLYDGSLHELAAQSREDGRAPQLLLGSSPSADAITVEWRPGHGSRLQDRAEAVGLLHGGGIDIQLPTDASQTFTVSVIARLLLHANKLYVPSRAVTRSLNTNDKALAGDYLLARLRDSSHSATTEYVITASRGDIVRGALGAAVTATYESLLPVGDPAVVGSSILTGIANPDFVRVISGTSQPMLSKLPESGGNISWANFAGAPLITEIRPRSASDVEAVMRKLATAHGVHIRDVRVDGVDGEEVGGSASRWNRFAAVTFRMG